LVIDSPSSLLLWFLPTSRSLYNKKTLRAPFAFLDPDPPPGALLRAAGGVGAGARPSAGVRPGRPAAQPILPAVEAVRSQPADAIVDAAIQENVRRAVASLSAVPLLADLVAKNKLMIVGAEYRLKTGRVDLIKP
jgi:hypothetical protein